MGGAKEFWADVADSMRPEKIDAKGLCEDRKSQDLKRIDRRIREYRRNSRDYLEITVCLATLGHSEAMSLARAFAQFFACPELPIAERLHAAGLLG